MERSDIRARNRPGRACPACRFAPCGYNISSSIDQRLIHKRVDHLPVLPAYAARRLRHPYHDELLARVDPPVGAARARPGEVANRAHHAYDTRRGSNRHAEAEAVV